MSRLRKYLVAFLTLAAVFTAAFFLVETMSERRASVPVPVSYEQTPASSSISQDAPSPVDEPQSPAVASNENMDDVVAEDLPREINLQIPFTAQAPHAVWDEPYKEFCEEASALMVYSYVMNESISGPDDADRKLMSVKDFEDEQFGYYKDTNAVETAIILRDHFGLEKVNVVTDPAVNDIKSALASRKAVIIPLAGREIGNPYYVQPGPLYHMLVIKGYTQDGEFITNDPGTKRGADFLYDQDVIMDAIADWGGDDIDKSRKVMIVVG